MSGTIAIKNQLLLNHKFSLDKSSPLFKNGPREGISDATTPYLPFMFI